jgi:hypothetical protein
MIDEFRIEEGEAASHIASRLPAAKPALSCPVAMKLTSSDTGLGFDGSFRSSMRSSQSSR